MDTAKVITRQLNYCLRAAETDAERQQVAWWREQVEKLRTQQPPAPEPEPAEAAHQRTGT